jgi:hypothetical protein
MLHTISLLSLFHSRRTRYYYSLYGNFETTETYKLEFEPTANEPLYPCALFYYGNDEVEFLQSE